MLNILLTTFSKIFDKTNNVKLSDIKDFLNVTTKDKYKKYF